MSPLDTLKADVNILVMVFVAFTLPFKVLSSKHSFCPTSDDVMSLSFAPLLSPCAMNSGSGKKQTETNLICVCGFLPNVSNFKTDKSRSHCKHNKVVINNNNPYLLHIQMTAWETSLINGCTHTHLLHTRRDLQSRFGRKKLIKRFKLQHKVKKNPKRYSS